MSEAFQGTSDTSPAPGGTSSAAMGGGLQAAMALHAARLRRGRKWKVAATAVLLLLLTTAGSIFGSEQRPEELFASVLDRGVLSLLAPLLGFLFGAGLLAEELEEGTFLFQAVRPAPRASIVAGRFLAASGWALGTWTVAVLSLHLMVFATSPGAMLAELPDTLRALGGGGLLLLWLLAVSALLGTLLPEAAGVSAGLYLLLVETGGTWLPGVLRLAVPSHHGRLLAGLPPRNLFDGVDSQVAERMLPPPVDWPVSVGVLTVGILVALALTTVTLANSEVRASRG